MLLIHTATWQPQAISEKCASCVLAVVNAPGVLMLRSSDVVAISLYSLASHKKV